ncbi:M23/M56 family metallopeptidase [uncultured Intestinimonas sp.]|uniref:M23/M56 family metallopeptidase n=1 Tax=uncultured Intestinimonas sp. TaxID=1689265 RepID=UPI0025D8E21D|nr:M23/M56 family metallopeptidase [uncultured Intestinimonas sp.]
MAGLVQRLGELSLTTSVVLLPLLLLSGQLERRYRAEGRVLLWLLLALWLLLPVRWAPPEAAVLSLPAPQPAQVWGEGEPEDWRVPQAPASTPETPDPAWRWEEAVPWLWLAGCGGLLLWQSAGALLVRRRLLRGAEEKPEDQILLARLWHGEHGPPRVLRTEAAGPPLSLGLLRPVVVLPPDLAGEEAELVLRHELAHIRRHDLWAKALLNLANAAHWFNPLVWWMVRRAGRDLELRCDDAVVAGQDAAFRHRYGGVLLGWAARTPAGSRCAAPLSGGAREMKGRIMNLFTAKKTGVLLTGLCLCAAMLLGILVTFGRAQAQTEDMTAQEALDALGESVALSDKEFSFTIPAGYQPDTDWLIQVSGRYKGENGMSMSLHLVDNDGTQGRWKAGERYVFDLTDDDLTHMELTLWAWLPDESGEVLELQVEFLYSVVSAKGSEETAQKISAQEETLQWPLPGYTEVSMIFGTRVHPISGRTTSHDGVDIPAPSGAPVLAAASGQVAEAGWDSSDGSYVLLTHEGDRTTRYCHLSQVSVAAGETVTAGQAIGAVGATGMATGPHLHLEAAVGGTFADPLAHYPSMTFTYR